MKIAGRAFAREELMARVGNSSQLVGAYPFEFESGPARGMRALECWNSAGLQFAVLPDRGMDIGALRYRGLSLAWISPRGPIAPAFYRPEGWGWVHTFGGGGLVSCGLTTMGVPAKDAGEDLPLHGQISHVPADFCTADTVWRGDTPALQIHGKIREAVPFGRNLTLERTILMPADQPSIHISDKITNCAHAPTAHMMLFHINLGFPLVGEGAHIDANLKDIVAREDGISPAGFGTWAEISAPQPDYVEQIFYATMAPDSQGYTQIALVNPVLDLALTIRYRAAELPYCVIWKMLAPGSYVVGLEPCNAWEEGRDKERAAGRLRTLAPGEEVAYDLELVVGRAEQDR